MTSSTQGWGWRVTNVLGMGFVQQMQLAAVDAAGKAQGGVWGHSAGSQLCPACVSLWIFVSDGHRHPCSHPEENGLHEIVSPIDFLGGFSVLCHLQYLPRHPTRADDVSTCSSTPPPLILRAAVVFLQERSVTHCLHSLNAASDSRRCFGKQPMSTHCSSLYWTLSIWISQKNSCCAWSLPCWTSGSVGVQATLQQSGKFPISPASWRPG